MRVRVYDQDEDSCFISELYAIIDTGISARCLVTFEGKLRFYHQVLPSENGFYRTMVSMVDPEYPAEWIHTTAAPQFHGYPWVWEDQLALTRLLDGEQIPLSETSYPPVSSCLPGWNYVTDSASADAFMYEMGDFHDAVLAEAHYTSGSKKAPDGGLFVMDSVRQVTLLFHNYDVPPIELVFEGVKAFNLRPGGNNCVTAISEAACRVRNSMVFFSCGWCPEEEEMSCKDTCIWAYSMRWRYQVEEDEE